MRIDKKIEDFSVSTLEHYFASDFSSSVFVILAEKYLNLRQYNRGIKVCEMGLSKDPTNILGKFILAKIYLCSGSLKKSENLLINILLFNPNAINPLKLLIEIQLKLNRDADKIKVYVDQLIKLLPNDTYYLDLLDNSKNIKKQPKPIVKHQNYKHNNFKIDDNMATFAFYNIVKSQKKYSFAHNILMTLEKKIGLTPKINEEKKVLSALIDKQFL